LEKDNRNDLIRLIKDKAREFGADLAGIANVADLRRSPSHTISGSGKMPEVNDVGTLSVENHRRGLVQWPASARSAVVLGVAHPAAQPDLDWWITGRSGGNTAG
jgi:epoxyqueuosine reductase